MATPRKALAFPFRRGGIPPTEVAGSLPDRAAELEASLEATAAVPGLPDPLAADAPTGRSSSPPQAVALDGDATAGTVPPPISDPPAAPGQGGAADQATPPPPGPRSVGASWYSGPPPRTFDHHPGVLAARAVVQRVHAELEDVRAQIASISEAVEQGRALSRQRSIEAKLKGTPEAVKLAGEARAMFANASEALAALQAEEEAGATALEIARADLEREAQAAAGHDAAAVTRLVNDRERLLKLRADLVAGLDWLYLRSRLNGAGTGNAGHLLADFLQLALSGEAMFARSERLFSRLLTEARAATTEEEVRA